VKLTWAPLAIEDRDSIFSYIAADNPDAAIDLDELIEQKAALLIEQPQMGRAGRVRGTRELVVHPHYVFVYDVEGSRIRILRALHTSLQYPARQRPARPRRPK
jgi:addiction module RelE/StbE family toxin